MNTPTMAMFNGMVVWGQVVVDGQAQYVTTPLVDRVATAPVPGMPVYLVPVPPQPPVVVQQPQQPRVKQEAGVVKCKQSQALPMHATSICANCHTSKTTLWRRNPSGEPECNSCHLYWMKNGVPRPLELAHREIKRRLRAGAVKGETRQHVKKEEPEPEQVKMEEGEAQGCTHCHTTQTPMWRRNSTTGAQECNACNLYYRKHGVLRPLVLANRRRGSRVRAAVGVVKKEEFIEYKPVIVKKELVEGPKEVFDFEEFMAL